MFKTKGGGAQRLFEFTTMLKETAMVIENNNI